LPANLTKGQNLIPGRNPGDPSRPAAGRASRLREACSPSQTGGVSNGAASFWEAVTSGDIRLSAREDALIWRLRALGGSWDFIAAEILAARAIRRSRIANSARNIATAKRARAAIRQEKA